MINFLKKFYESLYDLPSFYLGIEGEIYCHIFSVLFLFILIGFVIFVIKNTLEVHVIRKERKVIKRDIDKLLIKTLKDEKKDKKNKNRGWRH